jgi:hypothetical protein
VTEQDAIKEQSRKRDEEPVRASCKSLSSLFDQDISPHPCLLEESDDVLRDERQNRATAVPDPLDVVSQEVVYIEVEA